MKHEREFFLGHSHAEQKRLQQQSGTRDGVGIAF